eukprot:TRINITY_DN1250_c1_g1_i2.p1 TRINITY_DN1250_c1_g1~~TRINITY_DN1250_c1_g1_i2.p1  ORF type:complete len:998 (+),score=435.21 TRINITY_DN1250_c1_g1_i2:310-2994(+)
MNPFSKTEWDFHERPASITPQQNTNNNQNGSFGERTRRNGNNNNQNQNEQMTSNQVFHPANTIINPFSSQHSRSTLQHSSETPLSLSPFNNHSSSAPPSSSSSSSLSLGSEGPSSSSLDPNPISRILQQPPSLFNSASPMIPKRKDSQSSLSSSAFTSSQPSNIFATPSSSANSLAQSHSSSNLLYSSPFAPHSQNQRISSSASSTAASSPSPSSSRQFLSASDHTQMRSASSMDADDQEDEEGNGGPLQSSEVSQTISRLEELVHQEALLIQQFRREFTSPSPPHLLMSSPADLANLGSRLSTLWRMKTRTLQGLVIVDNPPDNPLSLSESKKHTATSSIGTLTVVQHPAESIVANRYMIPYPAVSFVLNKSSTPAFSHSLIVRVSLSYFDAAEEIAKTSDGKQDLLQGVKTVNIDATGQAIFNKLKIMEVSSKHKHQPFCLIFELEKYGEHGNKEPVMKVKSTPFQVQSRPSKRRFEHSSNNETPTKRLRISETGVNGGGHHANGSDSADGEGENEMDDDDDVKMSISTDPDHPSLKRSDSREHRPKKVSRASLHRSAPDGLSSHSAGEGGDAEMRSPAGNQDPDDIKFVDITELLVLPQKEAAKRLGISESMLCKRFKESTRRKWPYRNLRKIEKVVNAMRAHKLDNCLTMDERDRIDRLQQEKRECLKPVRIRLTPSDKIPFVLNRSKSSFTEEVDDGWCSEEEDEVSDEEISSEVIMTLETLRTSKDHAPPPKSSGTKKRSTSSQTPPISPSHPTSSSSSSLTPPQPSSLSSSSSASSSSLSDAPTQDSQPDSQPLIEPPVVLFPPRRSGNLPLPACPSPEPPAPVQMLPYGAAQTLSKSADGWKKAASKEIRKSGVHPTLSSQTSVFPPPSSSSDQTSESPAPRDSSN